MGPRSASMRHINVDMAPALTESSQSHDFVLPAKHKPLLTLHFAPSVLSKPMDDFNSPEPEVINGLTFSAFKFPLVDKCKLVENVDCITMNGNGDKDTININMGHTEEHKVENEMDQLLKNVPNSVLMDVIKDAISPDVSTEQPFQNSDVKFGQTLFDHVDVTNICESASEEVVADNSIVVENINKNILEDDAIKTRIESIQTKKELAEERINSLLQRACRIHTRLIGTHASSEINLVLDCISQSYLYDTSDISVNRLVEALETNIQQQQTIFTPANSYFGSSDVDKTDLNKAPSSLVKLNPEYQRTLEEVPGHLQTQLKAVQSKIDSDATASSSEAESCDEMQNFSNSHQLELPIGKRASWRWNKDRCRLGGKWSWLLTQIGDVESRLREYHHAQRKLRAARTATSNTSVNGYHGVQVPSVSVESDDQCDSCARTRGYDSTTHRKRKVFRLRDLARAHPKLATPAPVRCGCTPPRAACTLCLGRPDPTRPRERLYQDGEKSRIALVDSAYHPNTSFDADVSRRVHLEAVMCTPWWQSKPQPFSLKQRKLLSGPDSFTPQLKKHTNSLAVPLSNEASKTKRKYKKRRKLDSTGGGDTKAPSSGGKSSAVDLLPRPSRPRRAVATQQHWNHLLRDDEEEDDPMEEDSGEEYDEEMMNSPAPSHTGKDFRTRRRESSYDIDNIVIPYSVAATTRVEVLQYKEIPTPRWRFVEGDLVNSSTGDLTAPTTLYTHGRKNGDLVTPVDSVAFMSSDEEDGWLEDISDETLARRHEKYELEERKKFRSYVLPGFTTSRRAHKRTDSRAESSGANTPDAGSPKHQAAEFSSSHHPPPFSPLSSPPLSHSGDTGEAGQHPKRRSFNSRTMTLSESDRPPSPDSQDEVSPYSPLQFPLSDEQYARLLKDMPPGHPTMEDRNYSYEDQTAPPPVISPALSIQVQMPEPESPAALMSDSGDSSEDPNDPEWTFESKNPAALERYRTSKTKQYFEY